MTRTCLAVLGAMLIAAGPAAAQSPAKASPPTRAEKVMIATVEAEAGRNVKLLEDLVRVNSGSMNFAGVEKVGQMMRAELEPLGFQVQWLPMAQVNRAGHIVATHKGDGRGKRMLLIGHLDTVFELSSPFQGWQRRGDIVEGPGVNDMKGGDVIIVSALRAMKAAGTLKDADITVVLTGDEEKPGEPLSVDRAALIEAAKQADVALDFESLQQEGGRDIGSIARRSANSWVLKATAPSGHSSGVCRQGPGCGAIYELVRILDEFRRELAEPNLTYNVGMVAGGASASLNVALTDAKASGKSNVIPAEAVAMGDIRTLSNEQEARVRAKMQAIVGRHLAKTDATLTFEDTGYPPMAPTPGNVALLAKLNAVNATLGLPEMPAGDPDRRGAGDISFVAFIDGLVGLGAGGDGSHAPGETADLKTLDRQAKRAALLMSRLAAEKR